MTVQRSAEGVCRLCKSWCTLQKSHAIPDSLFRRVFKRGSGSAVGLTNDAETDIQRTQDSWADYLLCSGCESKLNTQYDVSGDRFSRGTGLTIEPLSTFVRISNLDVQRLRMYFLSVLWRMAESSAPEYQSVRLRSELRGRLAQGLLDNKPINESAMSVRLDQLVDSSGAEGFSRDDIDHLIVSPWCDVDERQTCATFRFFHVGYLVSVRIPGLSVSGRRQLGVLTGRSGTLVIPVVDLFNLPKFVDVLMVTMDKQSRGKVSKGVQRISEQHRLRKSGGI